MPRTSILGTFTSSLIINNRDKYGWVPYQVVLHAAIANVFGNKTLKDSNYLAFKTVKLNELDCKLEILKKMVKKTKDQSLVDSLHELSLNYANPLYQLLFMRLTLVSWKR